MKTELLGFRALPEEVVLADNLAKQLKCSRSEAMRRVLWAASGTHQPHPVFDLEKINNLDTQLSTAGVKAVRA